MDYEKFKEIVVKSRWGEEAKSGDEYRSLRIQLDHFVEHIKEEDSPLQWLPLDDMSEDELAIIANRFLDRCAENRLLFRGLSYSGLKYNYNDLLVENPDREYELEMILETLPELKNYNKLRITELIEEINVVLVGAAYQGYQLTANRLLQYIDVIRAEIFDEKKLFLCIGLGFTNTDYIEQYITVCERIGFGALYFFVIENANISDKMETLNKISQKLNAAFDVLLERLDEAKKQYKILRDFHEEYHGVPQNKAEDIGLYYVQFLNRRAYYDEIDNIVSIIQAEPFVPKQDSPCLLENENEMQTYISEGENIPAFNIKLQESKQLIGFARKQDNYWGASSDAPSVKTVLREGYLSKVKYQRRTAATIIRNILAGEQPSMQELLFLDMKMLHGAFREKGLTEEYPLFMQICSRVRKMYLLAYSAIDDREAYNIVYRTCFEFLYLFGDSNYTGIKFE